MKYLNLGCGQRYHPDWTNIDFTSTGEGVIASDLTQGIPFPDRTFDVVYHSHVLEHFSKKQAEFFIQECQRVLKPQGVIRVVVPDLETIARTYLLALEKATTSPEWSANYDWILLEMYDQTVRNQLGGEMKEYLFQPKIPNEEFILSRCGMEAKILIDMGRQERQKSPPQVSESQAKKLFKAIYRFFRYPTYRRNQILKLLLGTEYKALEIGRFRQSGEVHQWMYDRYSLGWLLAKVGFASIVQRSATQSYIPNWSSWNLDTESDGSIYKPDSLYMEGVKPAE